MSRHRAHSDRVTDVAMVVTALAVVTVSGAAWCALMLWLSSAAV